jgi:hypothetical protein
MIRCYTTLAMFVNSRSRLELLCIYHSEIMTKRFMKNSLARFTLISLFGVVHKPNTTPEMAAISTLRRNKIPKKDKRELVDRGHLHYILQITPCSWSLWGLPAHHQNEHYRGGQRYDDCNWKNKRFFLSPQKEFQ